MNPQKDVLLLCSSAAEGRLFSVDEYERDTGGALSIPWLATPLLPVYIRSTESISVTPLNQVLHSDPDIFGGTPVFVGTRFPVQSLFDYLEGGEPLNDPGFR